MVKITLPRSGDRPLSFDGEELASVSSDALTGKKGSRWHELALYTAQDGLLVLSVNYRTQWEGELDHYSAILCENAADVAHQLQAYDPCDHVRGFPLYTKSMEIKQEMLFRDLRARYDQAVSDLLAEMPEELVVPRVEDVRFEEG